MNHLKIGQQVAFKKKKKTGGIFFKPTSPSLTNCMVLILVYSFLKLYLNLCKMRLPHQPEYQVRPLL